MLNIYQWNIPIAFKDLSGDMAKPQHLSYLSFIFTTFFHHPFGMIWFRRFARNYIIMEIRGNLSKETRVASLGHFFDDAFKRLDGIRREKPWKDHERSTMHFEWVTHFEGVNERFRLGRVQ